MDAMDITNLPAPQPERESKVIKEEYVEESIDSVNSEGEELSFEDLMCAMFDEVMQKKEVPAGEMLKSLNVENEALLNGEINVDEDVDSLIAKTVQNSEVLTEEIKDEKPFLPLIDEDFVVQEEDIPVIECELELSSSKIKDKKETKNIKEEAFKEEKKEEGLEVLPREEHRHAVNLIRERRETPQKLDTKDEEKDDVENIAENIIAQKPKKAIKKLNISVEDLRTVQEAGAGESTLATTEEGQMGAFDGEPSFSDGKNISTSQATTSNQKTEGSESVNSNQFSSILAEQIKANSAELVQRGKLVLRDGNVGEIRLQLKPAHLGVVRINLKMTGDKKMQGEVTVSSKEAYDAFENSMEDLVSSFKDAGFDTSSFNLNWKGGKEEVVREDLRDKYFSPEKTALGLREKLNVTENVYSYGQAENLNVLV